MDKVRATLADIDTLDTACHTASNRLSTLRTSKVSHDISTFHVLVIMHSSQLCRKLFTIEGSYPVQVLNDCPVSANYVHHSIVGQTQQSIKMNFIWNM